MASGDLEGRKRCGTWSGGQDLGIALEIPQISLCEKGQTE